MYCANRECPDFKQMGVPGEFVEGVTVCPFCGADLVAELPAMKPAAKEPEPEGNCTYGDSLGTIDDLDEELIVLATYGERQDADIVITHLLDNGIEVFESSDEAEEGGGRAAGIVVLVPRSQETQARALLDEAGNG